MLSVLYIFLFLYPALYFIFCALMENVAFVANFLKCYGFHQEIKLLYLHSLLMYELEVPVLQV